MKKTFPKQLTEFASLYMQGGLLGFRYGISKHIITINNRHYFIYGY